MGQSLYRNTELQSGDTGPQDAVRVDVPHTGSKTLHTVVACSAAFRGRVYVEASLSEAPTDSDWAQVAKFDFAMNVPGGPMIAPLSETKAKTISGIFAWMRISISPVSGYINTVEVF